MRLQCMVLGLLFSELAFFFYWKSDPNAERLEKSFRKGIEKGSI
ncbi:MAG: hypothetical protein ACLUUO_17120 [Sellimonas intestinalis]